MMSQASSQSAAARSTHREPRTALPSGPATVLFAHAGHDWITGAERCLLDLVSRIDRTRFRPVVVCDAPVLQQEVRRLGFEAELIGRWVAPGVTRVDVVDVRRHVRSILRRYDVALIHANSTEPFGTLLPEARRARVPLVLHMHVPALNPFDRLFAFLHQATVAVGVADHVVAPLREDGMTPRRLQVIYNAVDADRLEGGDARGLRQELGIDAHAFVAVSLGSLIHRKGHDVSVRALALARRRGLDAHLVICGKGDDTATDSTRLLRRMVRQYGVEDAVHLLGMRKDVGAILRDVADVYLSNAREEALPLNVLEAQWTGVAVLASDIAAHHEAMVPGVTGVLVPTENAGAVAEELLALAADPSRRTALAASGRELARRRFSMSRYVAEFEELYDRLLRRRRLTNGWLLGSAWPPVYSTWVQRMVLRRIGLYTPPPMAHYPVAASGVEPGIALDDLYWTDDELPFVDGYTAERAG